MLVDLELHVEGGDEAAAVEPVGGEGDQPVGSVDFGFEALHGDGDFGEKVGPAGGEGEGGEAALDALEFGAGGAQGVGTGSTCRPVIGGAGGEQESGALRRVLSGRGRRPMVGAYGYVATCPLYDFA